MKTAAHKTIAFGAGVFLAASLAVNADTPVYQNTTSDTGYSLNFANGDTIGNEIFLASPTTLSSFSFELYSSLADFGAGSVQMNVYLYANNGTPVNGHPTPNDSSPIWSSGAFTLQAQNDVNLGNGGYGETLIFDSLNVAVPSDFTFAATITGLPGGETLGFEMYNNVTVGGAGNDYWFNNGSGWVLDTTTYNNIGAQFNTVPEPSTFCLGALGGSMLVGALWLRRRQASKQN